MIIIPARLASMRFPQKMLAEVQGMPLIIRTALNALNVDEVVVACDDGVILELCERHGVRAVLTDKSHSSGTDRCAQACRILDLPKDEIVLNVQGDEPFLEKEVIEKLAEITRGGEFMASLAKNITKEEAQDPNLVKVLLNHANEAIYFSRARIPFERDGGAQGGASGVQYLGHLGLYGFFNWSLQEFCALEKSLLEEIEKLEQLRAIYHHRPIKMAVVETKSIGIDTREDLERAQNLQL